MKTVISPNAPFEIRTKCLVFGSNEAGRHGKGAALSARQEWGAINGYGRGLQPSKGTKGKSFAIPTKDKNLKPRTLQEIRVDVTEFLDYARKHAEFDYYITRVGCGLAGFSDRDICPMFKNYPAHCYFDIVWGYENTWGTGAL